MLPESRLYVQLAIKDRSTSQRPRSHTSPITGGHSVFNGNLQFLDVWCWLEGDGPLSTNRRTVTGSRRSDGAIAIAELGGVVIVWPQGSDEPGIRASECWMKIICRSNAGRPWKVSHLPNGWGHVSRDLVRKILAASAALRPLPRERC